MINQKAQDNFFKKNWQSNIHLFKYSGANLVKEINDLKPKLVIDAGCAINYFKGKIPNLVGYDPAFKEADIMCGHFDAPFQPECADVILALGSVNWGNSDDVAHMLIKIKSWLKPGGRLYMRGAPGGYKSDKGLQWFQWGMKEINYFARLMDFDIEWVQIEHNITGPDGGTLSDRYWPHRYVWCYKRKLIK
tara:strand:- start:2871 stop:3443 length:573 start_codon:yes stop_codon:yes gene_type:complete